MWLRRVMVMAAAVMVASSACAGAPSEGPPDDGANASAVAAAVASSSSLATVEVFDASRTLTSSEANNAGNLQVMNFQQRRNAPSVAQGGLSIPGCGGTGVNAGGSRPGGSGFLGWSWTDGDCYLLLAAAQFTAIGMRHGPRDGRRAGSLREEGEARARPESEATISQLHLIRESRPDVGRCRA